MLSCNILTAPQRCIPAPPRISWFPSLEIKPQVQPLNTRHSSTMTFGDILSSMRCIRKHLRSYPCVPRRYFSALGSLPSSYSVAWGTLIAQNETAVRIFIPILFPRYNNCPTLLWNRFQRASSSSGGNHMRVCMRSMRFFWSFSITIKWIILYSAPA